MVLTSLIPNPSSLGMRLGLRTTYQDLYVDVLNCQEERLKPICPCWSNVYNYEVPVKQPHSQPSISFWELGMRLMQVR